MIRKIHIIIRFVVCATVIALCAHSCVAQSPVIQGGIIMSGSNSAGGGAAGGSNWMKSGGRLYPKIASLRVDGFAGCNFDDYIGNDDTLSFFNTGGIMGAAYFEGSLNSGNFYIDTTGLISAYYKRNSIPVGILVRNTASSLGNNVTQIQGLDSSTTNFAFSVHQGSATFGAAPHIMAWRNDGLVLFGATATDRSRFQVSEQGSNGVNYILAQPPAALAANWTWTWPESDGLASQFMMTDGSGVSSWQNVAGGSDTQVQFNDGGTVNGGDAGLTYNKTTNRLEGDLFTFTCSSCTTSAASSIITHGQMVMDFRYRYATLTARKDTLSFTNSAEIKSELATNLIPANTSSIRAGGYSSSVSHSGSSISKYHLFQSAISGATGNSTTIQNDTSSVFLKFMRTGVTTVTYTFDSVAKFSTYIQGTSAASMHNNTDAQGNVDEPEIRSGTYTPTLTNVTNVGASTAYECQWLRVGNVVTVSGKVDIDATAAAATELGMSLPVTSALDNEQNLAGTAASAVATTTPVPVRADAANNRAAFVFTAITTSNDSYFFSFTYVVI